MYMYMPHLVIHSSQMLNHLKDFSQKMVSRTHELEKQLDTLVREMKVCQGPDCLYTCTCVHMEFAMCAQHARLDTEAVCRCAVWMYMCVCVYIYRSFNCKALDGIIIIIQGCNTMYMYMYL